MAIIEKINSDNSLSSTITNNGLNLENNLNNNEINGKLNETVNMSSNILGDLNFSSTLQNNANIEGNFSEPELPSGHYVYIAYKDSEDSEELSNTFTNYLGIAVKTTYGRPSNVNGYTWFNIKGEKGEQGETGEKGEIGDAFLAIVNPLQYNLTLYKNDWTFNEDNILSQSKLLNNNYILDDNIPDEWKDYFNNLKITDRMVPLVDLKVSSNKELGLSQLDDWSKISRAYIIKEEDIDIETNETIELYYIIFQCYVEAPVNDLEVIVKVI